MGRAAGSNVRLGYSVYNRTLGLSSGRTLRRKIKDKYPHFENVVNRVRVNAECMVKILGWNLTNDYGYFRVSNFFIPVRGYSAAEIIDRIRTELAEISYLIAEGRMRLVFHTASVPFASGSTDDFKQRAADLFVFNELLDVLGASYDDGWIECHVGPRETFTRVDESEYRVIEQRFLSLPENVRKRITFENDEQWGVGEVHVLSERLSAPMTYDIMHHKLFFERGISRVAIPFTFTGVHQAVEWCRLSWLHRDNQWASTHVSSQAGDRKPGTHAEIIDYTDYAMLRRALHAVGGNYYINLESKQLDKSLQYIQEKIAAHKPRWATLNDVGVRV